MERGESERGESERGKESRGREGEVEERKRGVERERERVRAKRE